MPLGLPVSVVLAVLFSLSLITGISTYIGPFWQVLGALGSLAYGMICNRSTTRDLGRLDPLEEQEQIRRQSRAIALRASAQKRSRELVSFPFRTQRSAPTESLTDFDRALPKRIFLVSQRVDDLKLQPNGSVEFAVAKFSRAVGLARTAEGRKAPGGVAASTSRGRRSSLQGYGVAFFSTQGRKGCHDSPFTARTDIVEAGRDHG